jgi:signal transduction histidine kinase
VKLSKEVLAELVAMFRNALVEMRDISDDLRGLDLDVKDGEVVLADVWKEAHRADV